MIGDGLQNSFTANSDYNLHSTEASIAGDGFSIAKDYAFNDDYWLGKNRKFYNHGFNGNQYTGGKFKFARKLSKNLGGASNMLGAYSIWSTYSDYNNKISKNRMITD